MSRNPSIIRFEEGPLRCACCRRSLSCAVFNPNDGNDLTFLCRPCIERAWELLSFIGSKTKVAR